MPHPPRIALWLFIFFFLIFGCSKEEPTPLVKTVDYTSTPPRLVPSGYSKENTSRPETKESEENFFDTGEECLGHEYVILPGLTITLDFQFKLKNSPIPELGEKVIQEETVNLDIVRTIIQDWGKIGVIPKIESIYLDREDTTVSLWGLHTPVKKPGLEKGTHHDGSAGVLSGTEEVVFRAGTPEEVVVSFSRSGSYGLIQKIGGRYNARELAGLPYEKITELLGGDSRLNYQNETFPIEPILVPMINYYATLEIKTAFPSNLQAETNGYQYCLDIIGTPLCLNLSFQPKKGNRFHVTGPWEIWDCH